MVVRDLEPRLPAVDHEVVREPERRPAPVAKDPARLDLGGHLLAPAGDPHLVAAGAAVDRLLDDAALLEAEGAVEDRGPRAERALAGVGFSGRPGGGARAPTRAPSRARSAGRAAGPVALRAAAPGCARLHVPMVSDAAPRPAAAAVAAGRLPGTPDRRKIRTWAPRRGLLYLLVVALRSASAGPLWPRAPRLSAGRWRARPGDPTVVFLGDSITHGSPAAAERGVPAPAGPGAGCPRHQRRHLGRHDGRRAPAARAGRAGPPAPRWSWWSSA